MDISTSNTDQKATHPSRIVVFTDLDDSLIQTRGKLPPNANIELGAIDKDGRPLSFFTSSQRALLNLYEKAGALIIPVTGRNKDALDRVNYCFRYFMVVSHGAVILSNDGEICPDWKAYIAPQLQDWAYKLSSANEKINALIQQNQLDARSRVIVDQGIPAYVSIKGSPEALAEIKQNVSIDPQFIRHENGRHHALMTPYTSKRNAVEFLIKRMQLTVNDVVIGIGDSLSDLPFMNQCQFLMIPNISQINKNISELLPISGLAVPDLAFSDLRANNKPQTDAPKALQMPFSGSYRPQDCQFLLTPLTPNYQSIEDKELLIQSGQMHYSEVIHQEKAPSREYSQLFEQLTQQYKKRLADEVMRLAQVICDGRQGNITLVSLARAGTPIGVLLQRAITHHLNRQSTHYSISIIRDKGIDTNALDHILRQQDDHSIVFVDGWTAKGVITKELHQSVRAYNQKNQTNIPEQLFVISDIGGTADRQVTFDDYTIPSALMNSTVSGLVSRSILNDQIGENDFHGCVYYQELEAFDKSNWFIETVAHEMQTGVMAPLETESKQARQQRTQHFIQHIQQHHGVSDINRIKPGIAEATRVLLRRVPDLLIIRAREHGDTLHLERLASEKNIPVIIEPNMPFGACALIKDVT